MGDKGIETVLIVRVANGYLVYENESELAWSSQKSPVTARRVFETKESLFKYLDSDLK